MCGRNSVNLSKKELENYYGIDRNQSNFTESYNIAPQSNHPVIREGSRVLEDMEWNYIPEWADEYVKWQNKTINNIRVESADENGMFKHSWKKRRCLVPSTGFYEWKQKGQHKQPYRIRSEGMEVFSMAGLWTEIETKKGKIKTFGVITRDTVGDMEDIHSRMPVIIPEDQEDAWMKAELSKEELLQSSLTEIQAEKVSKKVNDPRNDTKEVLNVGSRQSKLNL